jgi:hypothetical protein
LDPQSECLIQRQSFSFPAYPACLLLFRLHFAAGFFGVQNYQAQYRQLVTIEADGFNNTLSPYDICPNANNEIAGFGRTQANKWAAIFSRMRSGDYNLRLRGSR